MTTTASLIGARVRRIDAPSADLWAITLVAAEVRGTLIISLQPGATGIGWSEKRPHGMPATSFVLKCRKELEGGRLLGLEEVGSRCELSIGRTDQELRLAFDFARQNILLYAADTLIASAHKEAVESPSAAGRPSAQRRAVKRGEGGARESTARAANVRATSAIAGTRSPAREPATAATHEPATAATHEPATAATHEPATAATHEPATAATHEPATAATHEPATSADRGPATATLDRESRFADEAERRIRDDAMPGESNAAPHESDTGARVPRIAIDIPMSSAQEAATSSRDCESRFADEAARRVRDDAMPGESNAAAHESDTAARVPRIAIDIPLEELTERARTLLADRGEALLALRKTALARGLKTTRKKLSRKLDAIAGDAARAAEAPALRQRAQLLLANLHAIPRGASTVRVLDYNLDPPAEVDIALDPAQSPREIAEAWFKRAKRFERGANVAAERAAAGQQELAVLDALEREIQGCTRVEALDAVAIKAERLGVKSDFSTQPQAAKAREPQRRVPYRILLGSGDRQILVGKGSSDNDVLTRDHARPHDLWLHARDVAGAHVVVPLEKGEVCPQDLLIDAAHAAAHFSESRGETTVDVSYTPRRYVRKPKGSPPGLVVLDREKVLRLQLEAARLAKLLQSERT